MNDTHALRLAKRGTRLSNLVVDTIFFNLIIIGHAFFFEWIGVVVPEEGSVWLGVYYFTLYFAYYFLFELFANRTPAKFITTTIVLNRSGGKPSLQQILVRSLIRLIPFEWLSFLFSEVGWHDSISGTIVVDD